MSKINQFLDKQQSDIRSIFVSSYVPRKCGIATYTRDLVKSLNDLNSESLSEILAVNNGEANLEYPWDVKYKIQQEKFDSYFQAAEYVNQSSADVVCLQHEYGLFGGEQGEYIFGFLRSVNKPIVTTFHTILANPTELQQSILHRLSELSESVIAMIPDAKERLERDYDIDRDKVVVIHHGVTEWDNEQRIKLPKKFKSRKVLLISGLISPNKGIESAISALPKIVKNFPDALLVIAGQTHPSILKNEGEKYRKSLKKMAKKLKVENNILFINEYLSIQDLLTLYNFTDIYLTPHIDPQQITSGTLAYAIGMGKACISTPYPYAKEMLADGRGVMVKFGNSEEIAKAVIKILGNQKFKQELEDAARFLGRRMRWPRVAQRYLNLFRYITYLKSNEETRIKTL